MTGKAIDIKECQRRLLRIANHFKQTCESNDIPYFMLGGTMLGAIRHHGFIPWDDDMDFGVPMEHYERLRVLLKSSLPNDIRVCEFQNIQGCRTAFLKLDDTHSCMDDKCVDLPIEEKLGVNIDIFPLVSCKRLGMKVCLHLLMTRLNSAIFTEPISGSRLRHHIKKVLQGLTPFSQDWLLHQLWKLTLSINNGNHYGNLFGRYRSKEIVLKTIFGNPTSYIFEDTTFNGPAKADEYLSILYGDYMKVPDNPSNHSSAIFERA